MNLKLYSEKYKCDIRSESVPVEQRLIFQVHPREEGNGNTLRF